MGKRKTSKLGPLAEVTECRNTKVLYCTNGTICKGLTPIQPPPRHPTTTPKMKLTQSDSQLPADIMETATTTAWQQVATLTTMLTANTTNNKIDYIPTLPKEADMDPVWGMGMVFQQRTGNLWYHFHIVASGQARHTPMRLVWRSNARLPGADQTSSPLRPKHKRWH